MQNVLLVIVLILFTVFLFGLTIFVHELGHFLAARALGLVVDVFSIGFGPAMVKKRIRGVLYKVGCIPLGGYVALPQLDPSAMEAVQSTDEGKAGGERRLPPVAPWRKIIVSLAGAAGNILLAILLAWVVWMHPDAVGGLDNTIGYVDPDSPAYAAGLRPGQRILAVNGEQTPTWNEVQIECHLGSSRDRVELALADPRVNGPPQTAIVPVTNLTADLRGIAGMTPATECVFVEVLPESPAEKAGLKPMDVVVSLDGVAVESSRHFIERVRERGERPLEIEVLRDDAPLRFTVVPSYNPEFERVMLGVELADMRNSVPMWLQFRKPRDQLMHDARGIFRLLRALVAPRTEGETGRAAGSLGGPLMIIVTLWMSVKAGLISSVGFMRFLNVNLAILNLLPIPVLDGGHIVFALWEMLTRRKPNARLVNWLVNLFAILLLGAVLIISRNDVMRLWRIFRVPRAEPASEAAAEEAEADAAAAPEAAIPPENGAAPE